MSGLILALLLAVSPEVQRPGEAMPWALAWDAPPGCPEHDAIVAHIRSYLPALDEPPAVVPRARLRVSARIEAGTTEWIAHLQLSGALGSSERSFSAATCAELGLAVALVAAVALDPVVVAERLEPSPEVAPRPEIETETKIETELEPQTPSAELDEIETFLHIASPAEPLAPRSFGLGVSVLGGGGYGPTRLGYGALGARFSMFGDRWRWSLDGGGWLPRRIESEQAGGRFSGWWVGTRGCYVPHLRSVEFPLCGGVELGQVRGTGLAPALNPRSTEHPWIAGSLGGGAAWVIRERVALSVAAAALVPFVDANFSVGDEVVQSFSPVGVRATFAAELRF